MSQYDNTNRGVLFNNERKESDRHPDMTGMLNISGVDYWFSGWWKDSESKGEFLSVSIGDPKESRRQHLRPEPELQRRGGRPVDPAPQQRQAPQGRRGGYPEPAGQRRASSGFDDMDDDISF